MAKRGEVKVILHQRVLKKCFPRLVEDLNVNRVMDFIIQKEVIHHIKIRDILDQVTTSDKIRKLIKCLLKKNESSYQKFKDCLEESGQSSIIDILEAEERKAKYALTANVCAATTSSRIITNYTVPMMPIWTPASTISGLSKGSTGWTICVRLVSKSNIFKKRKMDKGYYRIIEYFRAVFRDKTGEISAVIFKNAVVKFKILYRLLKPGQVFYVSGASVTEANPLYHRAYFELKFNKRTSIVPCTDTVDLPEIGEYNFVKISKLQDVEMDTLVDVIGVVHKVGEIEIVQTFLKEEETKRDLELVDDSRRVVSVTFWGTHARTFVKRSNPVIALLGVKVTDWRGCSLSRQSNTQIYIDPDIPEAHSLHSWYDNKGREMTFTWVE